MANNIQIKRKGDQSAPTGLLAGELAWSDNNAVSGNGGGAGFLYIGDLTTGTAVNRKIGGPGWGLEILDDSTLTGTPTVPTVATSDDSLSVANTEWTRLCGVTLLDDTVLTGVPVAPTVADTDDSTKIATTAWANLWKLLVLNDTALTGVPTAPTVATADDSTKIATTAWSRLWGVTLLDNTVLTGNPTAPTASPGDNDTSVATTAYTDAAVAAHTTAATQAQLNNTTLIATTAYVDLAVANAAIDFLNDIGNVTTTGLADGDMILYDTTTSLWKNQVMSGHVSIDETGATVVSDVAANAVALGAQTTGAYVATITAGDNIVVTGSGAESAATTIALDTNVTIAGNLTVQGATTTVDSTTVSVADPIFVIGESGASDDGKDRGIEFNYFDGSAKSGFFGYDNSAGAFTFIADATNTAEVFAGAAANVAFGDIAGTLTTASQTNITGLGTIGTGVWNSTAIAPLYGGTGGDSSSATGVAVVTGGTWSYETNLDVGVGGTGLSTISTDGILLGNGVGNMTVLAVGTAGQKLAIGSGGSPEWSDAIDGGTW